MPSTNVEFVTELMEFSAHGALIQAFVMQALEQYARRVAETDPQALDTPMVSGRAWHGCAVEVRDKLARRLGRTNENQVATAPTRER
ncbi:hypothetical protein BKP43_38690 [Variovorax boronicumulans]|uniref:hypothetical protein n=1 Tax=Variovorax boronicumulans TaxID=436515 RepID=UPI000BB337FF|nr:hypothetical protein [Variovorax boronicumulans]PBI87803.1 hypothetical protein BKP43_38690 [Variovorax boronicumulans]